MLDCLDNIDMVNTNMYITIYFYIEFLTRKVYLLFFHRCETSKKIQINFSSQKSIECKKKFFTRM